MTKIIAIQGQAGSFHDEVAALYFSKTSNRVYCKSFHDVFNAVDSGEATHGIAAIENSLAGSINLVYDLLLSKDLHIIGEYYLKVNMCLLAANDIAPSTIKEIYSHPVALAQCSQFLQENLPQAKRLEYHDTAAAAELIATKGNNVAAIASPAAAKLHNLSIISEHIEDNKNSYTRFIVFTKQQADTKNANKTSLVLRTSHKPGALYEALGAFAKNNINLSKLQSRPLPDEPWKYMFYIDVECGVQDEKLQRAFASLKEQACHCTVLGSYLAGKK